MIYSLKPNWTICCLPMQSFAFLQLSFAMLTTRSISPARSENSQKFCDLCVSSASSFEMKRLPLFSSSVRRQFLICARVKCWNFHETSIDILCQLFAGWNENISQLNKHPYTYFVNKFSQLLLSTLHLHMRLRFSFSGFFYNERLLLGNNKNKSIRLIHCWRV